MSGFRLQAKNILLTYSQIDNDTHTAFLQPTTSHFDHVTTTFGTPNVYRLGREQHQDGGTHFHVFLSFGRKISCRNERAFDFAGSHPNIKTIPRTPEKAFDYAGKDGDILHEHGNRPGKPGALSSGRDSVWSDALTTEHKEEFLTTLRERAPRDYVLYNDQIERFGERYFFTAPPDYHSPNFTPILPEELKQWVEQSGIGNGIGGPRPKSLILWGPTRTGKTVWARSLGR